MSVKTLMKKHQFFLRPLKKIHRSGWLRIGIDKKDCENVAEHTLKVAKAAECFGLEKRYIEMALIHDMPEIIAGDITPHDGISKRKQREIEFNALKKLTKDKNMMGLWKEYARNQTRGAKIIHQLDKLDATIQAMVYECKGYETKEFHPYTRARLKDKKLIKIFNEMQSLRKNSRKKDVDFYKIYFDLLSK